MEVHKYVQSWLKRCSTAKKQIDDPADSSVACFPPGHYFSTIVAQYDIQKRRNTIWGSVDKDGIPGVALRTAAQLELVGALSQYYAAMPFAENATPGMRYYLENGSYAYTDGIVLYALIRHFSPKRVIEIGAGFSSAVMLDTNELFMGGRIVFTFIEPFAERFFGLISDQDRTDTNIIEREVQDVDPAIFDQLEAGDILFVDSSHVVKTGSDVHYILFNVLPRLKSGVIIHFHDVFYPFEYPEDWVIEGRNWNEDYFLRAFLSYNSAFEILLFSHYLHTHHRDAFKDMPLCYRNPGGNLWLRKL